MKDLLTEKFDSKLSQVKDSAKDSSTKVQNMFESDINNLKAEMANLQSSVKTSLAKGLSSQNDGGRTPRPSRLDSQMSLNKVVDSQSTQQL